jgi:hypothetical protein
VVSNCRPSQFAYAPPVKVDDKKDKAKVGLAAGGGAAPVWQRAAVLLGGAGAVLGLGLWAVAAGRLTQPCRG